MAQGNRRYRAWLFTINNPTEQLVWSAKITRYAVWQLEEGKEKTPHYQGYVYYKGARTMKAVSRDLPRARLQKADGSAASNKKYCTKDEGRLEGPWEFGAMPEQGRRKDLETVALAIRNEGLDKAIDDNLGQYMRYTKGFHAVSYWSMCKARKAQGRITVKVRIYHGPTGTGKTTHAYEKYGIENIFDVHHTNGKVWYDGYAGESVLLFDDFAGGLPYKALQKMVNGWPYSGEIKGGHRMLLFDTIVFTSNKHPLCWYAKRLLNLDNNQDDWIRRLEDPNLNVRVIEWPKQ